MKQYAIFLDASALVAYFNIEDDFHKQASEIIDFEGVIRVENLSNLKLKIGNKL